MAVAPSPSGGVVIGGPTLCTSGLWMTSCLLISQCHLTSPPSWSAARTRSLGLVYKLCAVTAVAGQRTHGTTFRALKVTSQVATPGAESAVHDCLVSSIIFENEILLIPGCGSSNQLLTNVLSDSSCSGGNCQCIYYHCNTLHSTFYLKHTLTKDRLYDKSKHQNQLDAELIGCTNIHCVSKKQDTKLLPITSPNVNRFSKFFHWQTHW